MPLPTPAFAIDTAALERNLAVLREVKRRTGCRILLALKAFSMFSVFPLLRRTLVEARGVLSPRERECLALAFGGLTARQSAERMACSERTVNYHLANAMAKLKVDNKLAAVQRACWIGAL